MTTTEALLEWYDVHARAMAWRIGPADKKRGKIPDPYHVWLSEVMLQQTTVVTVDAYFREFIERWPSISDLADASDDQVLAAWAGLGYYARARNLLKCARCVVTDFGEVFPTTYELLLTLPGIGPYTAAAISSIAFDKPHAVLDGNVERVIARLFDVSEPLPQAKPTLRDHAQSMLPDQRPGDFNQAVMDLGATICTPTSPKCQQCPVSDWCMARRNETILFRPQRAPRKPKPVRQGHAYVLRDRSGAVLLEKRPEKGLLGGMLGWPGSDWAEHATPSPPIDVIWRQLDETVPHTFTHFHLKLTVHTACVEMIQPIGNQRLIMAQDFRRSDLPTVMRKVFDCFVNATEPV
ncbi:MAG: A/G-specific adenine glycosylase [Paracoccaceae bacterium]|jgi:A/G-specific adenine glycosylase